MRDRGTDDDGAAAQQPNSRPESLSAALHERNEENKTQNNFISGRPPSYAPNPSPAARLRRRRHRLVTDIECAVARFYRNGGALKIATAAAVSPLRSERTKNRQRIPFFPHGKTFRRPYSRPPAAAAPPSVLHSAPVAGSPVDFLPSSLRTPRPQSCFPRASLVAGQLHPGTFMSAPCASAVASAQTKLPGETRCRRTAVP